MVGAKERFGLAEVTTCQGRRNEIAEQCGRTSPTERALRSAFVGLDELLKFVTDDLAGAAVG
jgi:hypothetical protein